MSWVRSVLGPKCLDTIYFTCYVSSFFTFSHFCIFTFYNYAEILSVSGHTLVIVLEQVLVLFDSWPVTSVALLWPQKHFLPRCMESRRGLVMWFLSVCLSLSFCLLSVCPSVHLSGKRLHCAKTRVVTVPLIPFPDQFCSVFQQKPRFRFGSVQFLVTYLPFSGILNREGTYAVSD